MVTISMFASIEKNKEDIEKMLNKKFETSGNKHLIGKIRTLKIKRVYKGENVWEANL